MNLGKWNRLSSNWARFLAFAFVAGVLLRMTYVQDMEYKEDEEYNFLQSQLIGTTQPWPWFGIPSGVYLVNPGMSIWVFALLAKILGIHTPTGLAHGVQAFALLGMALILPLAIRWISDEKERITWFWAFALAMVNPFLVFYQRKLWPEPFLPFFTLLTVMGWWRRDQKGWAFVWGLIGAWLGQIHMSGFFLSAALFIWTALWDPLKDLTQVPTSKTKETTQWPIWVLGSVVGALPLIPWAIHVFQNPVHQKMTSGWGEIFQLKYWVFWLTNPTGLTLGNPLGLLRGESNWAQISDFVRYPLVGGQATYVVGLFHLVTLGAVGVIYGSGIRRLWIARPWNAVAHPPKRLKNFGRSLIGRDSPTAFVQNSIFLGCGLLMTATGVVIRRYYMAVTFPFEFLFLVRIAQPESRTGRRALVALWIAELMISAHFVGYIHVNHGSTQGDYGEAYSVKHPSP